MTIPGIPAPLADAIEVCPWDGFAPSTIQFCERELCAWITQPANTWSNIGYFVLAGCLWRLARKEGNRSLDRFWLIPLLVGFGSTFYHLSSTFMAELCDLGGMFLFSALLVTFNLARLRGWSYTVASAVYGGIVTGSLALLVAVPPIGILLFTLHVTVALSTELGLYLGRRQRVAYAPLLRMCAVFAVAFVFWRLDYRRRLCDPDNHILGGHAAWHLLNSVCFYFAYRFYAQLTPEGRKSP